MGKTPADHAYKIMMRRVEAIRRFETRARLLRHDFVVNRSTRAEVEAIVDRVSRQPVAVELAAGRTNVLSLREIREELGFALDVLTLVDDPEDAARAKTDAVIGWSYAMLAPWERDVLAYCALFTGPFGLPALAAVLDLSRYPSTPLLGQIIRALWESAFLRWDADGTDVRYSVPIALRKFVLNRAQSSSSALMRAS